ncbi:MAG: hypothetical protein WAM97_10585 [Acidimicrobiales bacterium]
MSDDTEPDALDMAKTELGEAMVPDPIDMLSDCGPLAQLWFLHQCAYGVMQSFTGMLSGDEAADVADDSEPVRAYAALAKACGNLDGACQLLSLLPPDGA